MSTDKFDKVPRIVLDKEDRDSFQRTRANTTSTPAAPASSTNEPAPAKSNGGILFMLFMIAVGGYGVSYWLYQENQKTLAQLSSADDRIYELERKISATGEESEQSVVALRVQVNELKDKTDVLWQEMDKLWASAWRRNQTEIKELSAQVTRDVKNQEDKLSALQSDMSDSNNDLAVIQEQVNQQLKRADEINTSIDSVVRSRAESKQIVQDMGDQVATVALRIEALVERIDDLEALKEQVANLKNQSSRVRSQPRTQSPAVSVPPTSAPPTSVPATVGSTGTASATVARTAEASGND